MSVSAVDPFSLLLNLEQRYRRRQESAQGTSSGGEIVSGRLALRCGPWNLSLTMDQVAEIMPVPRFTRVPGVQAWLLGIANLRGRVITIIDLNHFLCATTSRRTGTSRIIVVRSDDWLYGLLVDEVIGMRHFGDETGKPPSQQIDPAIRPYVTTVLHGDNKDWLALDVKGLLENESFLDASV